MKYQIYSSADGKAGSRFGLPRRCTREGIDADSFLEACKIYHETYGWVQGKFRFFIENDVPYIQNSINTNLKTGLYQTWEEAIANSPKELEVYVPVYQHLVDQGIYDASSCDK